MASPFETEGTFLTQEQADHINERHVLRLLKAGNSGGLPSLSLLVFRYFMSMNHLFGHFLGSFLAISWPC